MEIKVYSLTQNLARLLNGRSRGEVYSYIYGSDEDEMLDNPKISEHQPAMPETVNNDDVSQGDFVLVRFCNKKNVAYYVGQVTKQYSDGDYEVKFLRKTAGGKFIFPATEDIASVQIKDVIQVLIDFTSHRDIFSFKDLNMTLNVM